MYLCVRGHVSVCWGIDLISFYDLSIGFWTCSDSVVFFFFLIVLLWLPRKDDNLLYIHDFLYLPDKQFGF